MAWNDRLQRRCHSMTQHRCQRESIAPALFQVTDKSKQLDSGSAQLAQTLAQMHALLASTSALTDQLSSSQQQLGAQQAKSHLLTQQLNGSQSECRWVCLKHSFAFRWKQWIYCCSCRACMLQSSKHCSCCNPHGTLIPSFHCSHAEQLQGSCPQGCPTHGCMSIV